MKVVEFIVSKGCNIEARDSIGCIGLNCAVDNRCSESVESMLGFSASNAADERWINPLVLSLDQGNDKITKL